MKYLILGAGPAGLAFANCLKDKGITDFLVLEKETEAGGLCRSVSADGAPLDIGGGHFLDVRRPKVNQFLFRFMPESEWNLFERDSRINLGGKLISHPLEANIWQMDTEEQVKYLKSIAVAGCNRNEKMPEDFIDWIYWKLGSEIAEKYMIPYNRKMFSEELNQLGTYWLEKLPNVSFEETLRSCLTHKAYGTQPGHAQFYYPKKFGYGELWIRLAENIKGNIEYGKSIGKIDFSSLTVFAKDGSRYQAENIITTIPWLEFEEIAGMPAGIRESLSDLKFSSVQIEYFPENLDTSCQWIYFPNPDIPYHRILVRHNFCPESRGYWTETNAVRTENNSENSNLRYMNRYAYPLNTKTKPQIMKELLSWCTEHRVYGLGRWGEHQHFNSDLTVERAMNLAERLEP